MAQQANSISKIIRELVSLRPSIRDCLIADVVNYSALARAMLKDIQKQGANSSEAAVKMALIRIAEDLKKEKNSSEKKMRAALAGTVIEVQSDLFVITSKKKAILNAFDTISSIMERSRFFQFTQGVDTFNIVASAEDKAGIARILGKAGITDVIENQTAIVLVSPDEIIETPGVVAFISNALASGGINITQVISCHKDTILVLGREDAPKAYGVLENLILGMRKA